MNRKCDLCDDDATVFLTQINATKFLTKTISENTSRAQYCKTCAETRDILSNLLPIRAMSWLQLDPPSLAIRTHSTPPSLGASIWRGIIGFTLLSIAGFIPWGVFGWWFKEHTGALTMYVTCAFVFIILSGPLLHRLIMGAGSLGRFYKLFGLSFTAYSVAWIAAWMPLHNHTGSAVGLLAGTAVMGWMLCKAFAAPEQLLKVILALFLLNSAGYFIGGVFEGMLLKQKECTIFGLTLSGTWQNIVAKMQWGLCYGIGLGAGLGVAYHLCQTKARAILGQTATAHSDALEK